MPVCSYPLSYIYYRSRHHQKLQPCAVKWVYQRGMIREAAVPNTANASAETVPVRSSFKIEAKSASFWRNTCRRTTLDWITDGQLLGRKMRISIHNCREQHGMHPLHGSLLCLKGENELFLSLGDGRQLEKVTCDSITNNCLLGRTMRPQFWGYEHHSMIQHTELSYTYE